MKISVIKPLFFLIALTLAGCASTKEKTSPHQTTRVAPRVDTPKLGDAEIRFEKTYGKPLDVSKNGFANYSNGQLTIQVHYSNGVAESILYTVFKGQPLDDYWVSRVLSLNSQGKAWVVKRGSKSNDIWYRTPDCNLLANYYKQRTLVVCTHQFRQWLWDQRGKGKLPPEQSKTSIFYPDCAYAFIGETKDRMNTILGTPSTGKNENVRVYNCENVTIRAQFENGRCEAIKYVSTKMKLSDHWVSGTLALNSAGVAWVVDEELRRGVKRFVTIDGKLHAVLKQQGNELMLYTEKLNQRTINRIESKQALCKSSVESKAASIRGN